MIKLVAVDMDGTLLNGQHAITPRTADVIRRAVNQGVAVTIATGRMYSSAAPYARQMEMDVPIITYNGAMISSALTGERLYHQPIEQESAREIVSLFRGRGWYIQTYIDDVLYIEEANEKSDYYTRMAGVDAVSLGQELYSVQGAPTKMLAIAEPDEICEIAEVVCTRFAGRIGAAVSNPRYLEMNQPGINKGTAIAFLADKLHLQREEIMAVGDSQNDLDMITYAGLGVAMGNASDRVKAAAQAVTASNEEDGVAAAIEKYVLGGS